MRQKLQDKSFLEEHKNKEGPLAFIALAGYVAESILNNKNSSGYNKYFHKGTFTVPPSTDMYNNPHYHSIVGQKLQLVDWKKTHGIEDFPCGMANCQGRIQYQRSNLSKNKVLFPIYMIDGPPIWCIVRPMQCSCCKRKTRMNDLEMLCRLPACVSSWYPVEHKYALGNKILILQGGQQLCLTK